MTSGAFEHYAFPFKVDGVHQIVGVLNLELDSGAVMEDDAGRPALLAALDNGHGPVPMAFTLDVAGVLIGFLESQADAAGVLPALRATVDQARQHWRDRPGVPDGR